MNNKIDLISLEITWNSLKSIADESYITLMKSAFSTNIKERHDHSTAITNSDGKLIVINISTGNVLKIDKVGRDLISKPLIYYENLFIVKNGSIIQYD